MAAITIDDSARFVSVVSFNLASGDVSAMAREVQHAVERRAPHIEGFKGCMVMVNGEKPHLLVVSIWESAHAWGAAQYDQEVGRVVSNVVETAASYDVQTYETVTVVRA
jgi:hypothetical protein